MAEQLKVDKAVLSAQIQKLKSLCQDTALKDAVTALEGPFTQSSGTSATAAGQVKGELQAIDTQLNLLFTRTLEFLSSRHEEFVIADEQT